MKIVILDALTFGETSLEGFKQFGDVDTYQTTTPQETLKRIENANVIVTNKVVITEAMIRTCAVRNEEVPSGHKDLKLICIAATGMNNVDLEAAKTNSIEVKNVAGYSTDSVIQHTFSILFYLIGHSRYYDEYVKDGSWAKSPVFTNVQEPFFEVKNKKWGIIGLGEIGRGVGSIAKAFGAEVSYYSTSGRNRTEDFQRQNLDDLLKESDIISIHSPLNEATSNLLDYEQLLTCKEGATILNLGRGGIINEEAVAKIIDEKELYFGLDVLEKEPMKEDHALLHVKQKERLYITPHIAWTSVEAREKLIAMTIQNIKESL
ncbi:MAG: D-2-hydroxyacid dehydrogenase [Campylobacterota bacterium]|nr:D-2-hydroxyacid dehydrogenase [Campylobacterota bacterium]